MSSKPSQVAVTGLLLARADGEIKTPPLAGRWLAG